MGVLISGLCNGKSAFKIILVHDYRFFSKFLKYSCIINKSCQKRFGNVISHSRLMRFEKLLRNQGMVAQGIVAQENSGVF